MLGLIGLECREGSIGTLRTGLPALSLPIHAVTVLDRAQARIPKACAHSTSSVARGTRPKQCYMQYQKRPT